MIVYSDGKSLVQPAVVKLCTDGVTGKQMNMYRIKYKSGNLEIELESDDKEFVEAKFKELVAKPSPNIPPPRGQAANDDSADNDFDVNAIVNAINESERYKTIEEKILNKSNVLNRILLVLYFINQIYPALAISTGGIQSVTDQLGVRISSANAATTIKNDSKYFAADTVRKKGAIVKYKINKKGIDEFEKLLS